jgi:hypothetical protein
LPAFTLFERCCRDRRAVMDATGRSIAVQLPLPDRGVYAAAPPLL